MRTYAVRDAQQAISTIAGDPLLPAQAAEGMRASGIQAELVYTEAAFSSVTSPDTQWFSAEAYQTGRTAGIRDANYGQAYENAHQDTAFVCDVPAHFYGPDADDYRSGHDEGVTSFWESDE